MKIEYPKGKGLSTQQWLAVGLCFLGIGIFLFLAFGPLSPEVPEGLLMVVGLIAATMLLVALRLISGRRLTSPLPTWVIIIGVSLIFIIRYYLTTVDVPL